MAVRGESEFLNLPFQEKLEFLYGLPARQKRDLILSAPEAERLVQSFSPETLFYTLKEIGSADAGDLLSLAMPEQVKSLFDLDCWNRDRPNVHRMREWIEAMADGGRRKLADALMGLDMEMMSILLRGYIKVHRIEDAASSPDATANRFAQYDENYLIEFIRHDAISQHISDFIEEAFERDYNYFGGLMEEIYWGVEAELEEEAYQFRRARLNDRGFPDFFDAQSVFAYIKPEQFLKIRAEYEPPSRADLPDDTEVIAPEMAPAIADGDVSLFNTALTAGFASQGKRQLRSEMAMVSNQVLVARAVDFGDLEAVRVAVEMTHHYLNLALEHLAGGDLRTLLKKAKRRGKRFSPAAAIHIAREVLSALAYAHVKRDLEGTPLKLIHRHSVFPIERVNGTLRVATSDPFDHELRYLLSRAEMRRFLDAIAARAAIWSAKRSCSAK